MARKSKILLILVCILLACSCFKKETDSEKFKKEYPSVSDNNYFKYKTSEDILKGIDKKETLLLFIGDNTDDWSNEIVSVIDSESKKEGVNIYYLNLSNSIDVTDKLEISNSSYIIGLIKGELKYYANKKHNEIVVKTIIDEMAVEINSCDIHDDGC